MITSKKRITDEQVEQVARAMWDSNPVQDDCPRWDDLADIDKDLKDEIRLMARAGIRKWLELTEVPA